MAADPVASGPTLRRRFCIAGVVQGVGFRPYVYRRAAELGLTGFVANDTAGVVVEVEGPAEAVAGFEVGLLAEPPPLAVVEDVTTRDLAPEGSMSFEIRESADGTGMRAPISPDIATCDACLAEMSDPNERRFGYAFTNCTDCGPRFTIATAIPYDRAATTMASFEMCAACRAEYEDPRDRRFHAQPIACPRCGPRLSLLDRTGAPVDGDPVAGAAAALRAGRIVALKGLGGYHLACDATDEAVVSELRRRKNREEKPLAVMVPDRRWARRIARPSAAEEGVLAGRRRPIVLVPRAPTSPVASGVAPGNRFLGVMLPYTPLHHLLMRAFDGPLVLTSGNLSDEPIVYEDDLVLDRLGGSADLFLGHDRPIRMRCDDSVVRVVDGVEYPLRRARGYAPEPLVVKSPFRRLVLAAGAELKSTFCLGAGTRAIVSHHIGDLESWDAMRAFRDAVAHFSAIYGLRPEVVAHDLHPEYLSTKWALDQEVVEHVGVQHHHAHIASCLADNRRAERVIGLALDGTGYGDDGAIWGCEILVCDLAGYRRAGHLRYVPLPGGSAAIKQPWRMAAVYLAEAFGEPAATDLDLDSVRSSRWRWAPVLKMARAGLNAPPTSSAGRLFDAAAALCGLRHTAGYEGQAAAELEQAADPGSDLAYPCPVTDGEIDGVALIGALAEDLVSGRAVPEAAAGFHNGLARALFDVSENLRGQEGLGTVALSGGTWQNLFLLERVRAGLEARGFEVLIHHRVPPNDGGISLGQAVVANARGDPTDVPGSLQAG
ncbi:MAG: carbamoyltransferase HypF [Actinomycetota bacterium]